MSIAYNRLFPAGPDALDAEKIARLGGYINEMIECQEPSAAELVMVLGEALLAQLNRAGLSWIERKRLMRIFERQVLGPPPPFGDLFA